MKRSTEIKETILIQKIERLPNSSVGNPQWAFHTAFGVYKTWPNAMCAYEVNYNWSGYQNIKYEQTSKGKFITSFSHL